MEVIASRFELPIGYVGKVLDYTNEGELLGEARGRVIRPATREEYIADMTAKGRPPDLSNPRSIVHAPYFYWTALD